MSLHGSLLVSKNHENIVQLKDVFCKPGELVLVFELCDSDLKKHMKVPVLSPSIQKLSQTNKHTHMCANIHSGACESV